MKNKAKKNFAISSWTNCKLTSVRFYFPWRKPWKTWEEPVVLPLAPHRSAGVMIWVSINFTSSISVLCPSIVAGLQELNQHMSSTMVLEGRDDTIPCLLEQGSTNPWAKSGLPCVVMFNHFPIIGHLFPIFYYYN